MEKKELINAGKVKNVFTTENDDEVIIEFRDDMTAGDGARKEVMDRKGAYNAVISAKIFKVLEENGVETQLIDLPQPNVMLAKKLEISEPVESKIVAQGNLIRKDNGLLASEMMESDFLSHKKFDEIFDDEFFLVLFLDNHIFH